MLVLEPAPHIDAIKSLRVALKILGRRLGLKCTDIREIKTVPPIPPEGGVTPVHPANRKE
jgi:hypothetical protein